MATRTAVASGAWSDPATWDGGTTIPADGDDITMDGGWTVSIDMAVTVNSLGAGGWGGGYLIPPESPAGTLLTITGGPIEGVSASLTVHAPQDEAVVVDVGTAHCFVYVVDTLD